MAYFPKSTAKNLNKYPVILKLFNLKPYAFVWKPKLVPRHKVSLIWPQFNPVRFIKRIYMFSVLAGFCDAPV